MNKAFRWFFAWLGASILTFVLASIFHTQFVLLNLTRINIDIPIVQWLGMTVSDIAGLALGCGSVIAITMLLCFGIAGLINKFWRQLPLWGYPILGALAIAFMLAAMQPLMGVTLIAGSRSVAGFLFQCSAGLIGGFIFAKIWLNSRNPN